MPKSWRRVPKVLRIDESARAGTGKSVAQNGRCEMSAFVVDRECIEYLVRAAQHYGVYWHWDGPNGEGITNDIREPDAPVRIANVLWAECVKSVQYRYPDCQKLTDLPGCIPDAEAGYELDRLRFFWGCIKAVEVLSAIGCYRYQSCEHPEWEASEAYGFVEALQAWAIRRLPGYEDAPHGAPIPMNPRTEQNA